MKSLNRQLIVAKCKTDNLKMIKNLNLWGNELEDVKILKEMCNLEVLSLSVNKIGSLRDFVNCKMLQELYLRQNQIRNIAEIKHLQKLPRLRILWLSENPCAQHPNYRVYVIKMLPNLIKLDKENISKQEREEAMGLADLEEEESESTQFNRKVNFDTIEEKRVSDIPEDYKPHPVDNESKGNKKKYPYKMQQEDQCMNYQRELHQSSGNQRHGPPQRPESDQYLYKKPMDHYQHQSHHSQKQFPPNNYNNDKVKKNPYLGDNQQRQNYKNKHHQHEHRGHHPQKYEHIGHQQRYNQNMHSPKKRKSHKDFIQNENVVSAILALIKDLNTAELDFLKREIEKKIEKRLYYMN